MYKTRIKKWSFCKNNRANEALAILTAKRQRGAIQEPSEFLIHGRPLDVDRFERYVRRRPDLVMQAARQAAADDSPFPGHLLARAVLVRTPPPPLLSRSGDPADMREEFLLIFDEWIKGSQ